MTWFWRLCCLFGRHEEGLVERVVSPGLRAWVLECRTCGRRRSRP